jgi:hypothetical protein
MAISGTSFFNAYQLILGATYSRGYQEVYNPSATIPNFVSARQLFLASMSSTDVTNGLSVVNAHLASEGTYSSAALSLVKNVEQTLNTFFYNTYKSYTRDYFCSLSTTTTVSWLNSFKESWYQANTQELVQQIGFMSWNGSAFTLYPPISPITNVQNSIGVSTASGNTVTVSGYFAPITNFALPGDIIVASATSSVPSISNISLSTTVVGYANTNTLILSGSVGSATSLFAYRPIKNTEYLEFRFGTASVTGFAATSVYQDVVLSVTLVGGVNTAVTIGAANTIGRVNIGIYNNSTYKATGISAITVTSGSVTSLGTQQSLELWVKSTN